MRIWALIAASLVSIAHAAWEDQFAGLWIDPRQPGWGVSVHQQGDHAIATLLTYGLDGQPKWYQADITLPPWDPYILWGTVTVGDILRERGLRDAGAITFTFDEDRTSLVYEIDGVRRYNEVTRFTFAPAGLQGIYTGVRSITGYGNCRGLPQTDSVRITASTSGDNMVRLVLKDGTATCIAEGAYQTVDSTPAISGRAQCVGSDGVSDTPFAMGNIHIARDTVSMNLNLGTSACGYWGPLVATRTDYRLTDDQPPHDDVSGLWRTDQGWSIAAHLQGNALFAIVLASDGSWYVAPNARYGGGQDGDFVAYGGDLWSVRGTRFNSAYELTAAGRVSLIVDAGGYSSASYGADATASWIARVTWPNDTSIAGTYMGMRTNLLPSTPTLELNQLTIADNKGSVRMTLRNGEEVQCEFDGNLAWQGRFGKIQGNGGCAGPNGVVRAAFQADDVQVTEQGISMRYWFNDAFGSIAGLRSQ